MMFQNSSIVDYAIASESVALNMESTTVRILFKERVTSNVGEEGQCTAAENTTIIIK